MGSCFFLTIGLSERLGFYWKGRAPEQPGWMPEVFPTVCVRLPLFNEPAVARRLIESTANMDWPADRFSIQVLDDPTDEEARRLVEQVSAEVRARGLECRVMHRTDRHGYKAGALEAGRRQTKAEFLVIFEADFVPPVDFLRQTIPHFYQQDGQPDASLALVQAKWGHLNHDESASTLSNRYGLTITILCKWPGGLLRGNSSTSPELPGCGVPRRLRLLVVGEPPVLWMMAN